MEVAAFVVSLIALAFAGGSWWASRRSANAAESSAREAAEVSRIESERRHEELFPEWSVEAHEIEDDLVEFRLTVRGPGDSYRVRIEPLPGCLVPAVRLDRRGDVSSGSLDLGEVRVGSDVLFYGDVFHDGTNEMRAKMFFEREDRTWKRLSEFKIRWRPRIY